MFLSVADVQQLVQVLKQAAEGQRRAEQEA